MAKHIFPRSLLSVEVLEDRCLMDTAIALVAPLGPGPSVPRLTISSEILIFPRQHSGDLRPVVPRVTIPIEILQLNLQSVKPVQVNPGGGTFSSQFNVLPVFTFTRQSGAASAKPQVAKQALPPATSPKCSTMAPPHVVVIFPQSVDCNRNGGPDECEPLPADIPVVIRPERVSPGHGREYTIIFGIWPSADYHPPVAHDPVAPRLPDLHGGQGATIWGRRREVPEYCYVPVRRLAVLLHQAGDIYGRSIFKSPADSNRR
ncbi:MAG: hypothetical protein HYR84_07515 [Planctomycetes bacterium]|nr:hypothetical protein [Planctomycetota bacterium]